jgi:hypothetical protein
LRLSRWSASVCGPDASALLLQRPKSRRLRLLSSEVSENTEDLNKLEKKLYVDLHSVGEAIDLIVSSPERYETSKESKYSIYSEIAKNGLVVYERLR